jgi:hypothetical protein
LVFVNGRRIEATAKASGTRVTYTFRPLILKENEDIEFV